MEQKGDRMMARNGKIARSFAAGPIPPPDRSRRPRGEYLDRPAENRDHSCLVKAARACSRNFSPNCEPVTRQMDPRRTIRNPQSQVRLSQV
jgi:hypothetical protein